MYGQNPNFQMMLEALRGASPMQYGQSVPTSAGIPPGIMSQILGAIGMPQYGQGAPMAPMAPMAPGAPPSQMLGAMGVGVPQVGQQAPMAPGALGQMPFAMGMPSSGIPPPTPFAPSMGAMKSTIGQQAPFAGPMGQMKTSINRPPGQTPMAPPAPAQARPGGRIAQPQWAKGFQGIIDEPTRPLIGEAGPEAVSVTPLTAPSFNPNRSISRIPTVSDASTVAPAAAPGQTPVGDPNAELAKWGYTGAIPINNMEQQAIDFVNNMYGSGGALGTLGPAQDYYNQVLQGKFGPEGQAYLQQVLDPMRSSAMQNYGDMSKALATKFSNVGGYYGGRSGVAQGRLAAQSANDMAQQEAQLRYQSYMDNMGRMSGAASGLTGLGQAQSGMSGDMLNYMLSTGNMITGRDLTNRSQYQQATQNAYNDWLRARGENLMPFSWGQNLLGQEATTPIVTQEQSPWGAALGALGNIGGAFATGGLSKILN